MGIDYALVHIKYTIPPAVILTLFYQPLCTRLDAYKVLFLVTIAVTATIPWDSYLIRSRVWSYPADAVLGPTLFGIPLEELFFFFIQTYDVSLLYLCISKPTLHPVYLPHGVITAGNAWLLQVFQKALGVFGSLCLLLGIAKGATLIYQGGTGSYIGLIIVWAFPFLLLLWSMSHRFIIRLPASNILIPILLPTFYLWLVDTFSLKRGTWVIGADTKTGYYLWSGLEIEEALFFFLTNTLIVWGLAAFDHSVAIIDTFPLLFPDASSLPSPLEAVKALLTPTRMYDATIILGLSQAINRLKNKSRSFYLASSAFHRRLRIDLVLLYSFCRAADDLIDGAKSVQEARKWISLMKKFLDIAYGQGSDSLTDGDLKRFVDTNFPSEVRLAFLQLPTTYLSKEPLYDLLEGFEVDLQFTEARQNEWPIQTASDLDHYGELVAGTVAKLCLDLVFHHYSSSTSLKATKSQVKESANKMGIALQIINIARDISVDADLQRVYIPSIWLEKAGLSPEAVLKDSNASQLEELRTMLLDRAFKLYDQARPALEELPVETRGPMRVAIESYVEIGRVLRQKNYKVKAGKATVPLPQRLWVAYSALKQ